MKDIKLRSEIPRLYLEDKLSSSQIGEIVGLTTGGVQSILRHKNVKMRSSKEGLKTRYPFGRFGELAAKWKGGKRKLKNGYIYTYKPQHRFATKDGYVMEHRLVLEQKLNRVLEPNEIAHHVNGRKDDNRPENIELTIRGQHTKNHFLDSFKTRELLNIINSCEHCKKQLEKPTKTLEK